MKEIGGDGDKSEETKDPVVGAEDQEETYPAVEAHHQRIDPAEVALCQREVDLATGHQDKDPPFRMHASPLSFTRRCAEMSAET
jgi:hypothetical protein